MQIDPQISSILSACSVSTQVTASTLFPERFSLPFAPQVHGKIFKLIDDPTIQKIAIAAPRGWGKTSILALAYAARHILFRLSPFIIYINKSHDAASLQTENLKRELATNKLVRQFFGPIKPRGLKNQEFEESYSKKAWVAYDTLIWPRGAGQQVRGVLFRNSRPTLILIDDLEDPQKITNDDIRHGWLEWLYADVVKAVPRTNHNWKIVYIDTLKHEDSVLQHLLDSSEWKSVRLEACDDDFKSTAPAFMSDEDILKEWNDHEAAGQTDVFFRELRNLPISTKDASFTTDYFKYYNLPEPSEAKNTLSITESDLSSDKLVETVLLVDPAKTVKLNSDDSAVVAVGIDLRNARLYVRDAIGTKLYPDELYSTIFTMAERYKVTAIGIEETSLNEFIKQPIKNEMLKNGKFFQIVWLKARGGMKKELRIKELVPYYRLGYVYHNAQCVGIKKLEQQLLMFPRSRLWDLMDALAYIVEMLEIGDRYFSPMDEGDDPEDEYSSISYDPPVENWRCI